MYKKEVYVPFTKKADAKKWIMGFCLASMLLAASIRDLLPRYDVKVYYEPRGCVDTLTKFNSSYEASCASDQTLVFTQDLGTGVYVLCSCKLRHHSTDMGPYLPGAPYTEDEAPKKEKTVEENDVIIPEGIYH